MNKAEVAKLFMIMTYSYPNFDYDETKVTIWYDFLKDYPFEHAQENLKNHINQSAFQPTIADIKKLTRKDPDQYVDYEKLRSETQYNLALMDEWQRSATKKGDIH
ncbi:MAG: hypothetical protein K0Q73_7212 [Paenibacillus sp.]|nr:hypothetical protein [Paenibacillus sp.]